MAATTTATTQIFQNHNNTTTTTTTNNEVSGQEIQAAIAKAVELRALHAALMQANSPANLRFPSASPVIHPASQFSAQDYPVFTPIRRPICCQLALQTKLHDPNLQGTLVSLTKDLSRVGLCRGKLSIDLHPLFAGEINLQRLEGTHSNQACQGAEVVFHMAAPDSSINNYELHHSVNVQGTKNVIDACIELKVMRLIHTSSPSVVFDGVHGIFNGDESLPYPAKMSTMSINTIPLFFYYLEQEQITTL